MEDQTVRPSLDETCLNVAAEWAKRSTCLRRAVGCVLINERGHTLSTGYNGRARGQGHCNEVTGRGYYPGATGDIEYDEHKNGCRGIVDHEFKKIEIVSGTQLDACEAIHAEQNALLQCRDVHSIHTCYVTHSPCVTCVKLLLNTSCKRIVFRERYAHDKASSDLWLPKDDAVMRHPNFDHEWVHHP